MALSIISCKLTEFSLEYLSITELSGSTIIEPDSSVTLVTSMRTW
jgi:hypothetical protein